MTQQQIRNFAIIAHVDHGKSTLADRFLEITKTVGDGQITEQFLDSNPISRERGITIKLAPVRMSYKNYILNLIDTPGHVDFSYEVSRTLAACEGVVLLVDATQGIQAQTVAHFNSAKKLNLVVIPVINKIDLPYANTEEIIDSFEKMFGIKKEEIIQISAKTGQNVEYLLTAIIEKIPPPQESTGSLRALVFDAIYDAHRGVVVYIRIVEGSLKKGERIRFFQGKTETQAVEVGFFNPYLIPQPVLVQGEIGYIVTGIKDIKKADVGDTIHLPYEKITPLPGYSKPKPMVFFGLYPTDGDLINRLKEALSKLALNDNSLAVVPEYSTFLGSGFRVGFLGLLHAEIVKERLSKEEGIDPLLTSPQVLYEERGGQMLEPFMNLTIYSPSQYVGAVMSVAQNKRGKLINISYMHNNAVLTYEMPFVMLVRGLSQDLKTVTSGFASIDYEIVDERPADLVKLDILINNVPVDVLSDLVYKDEAYVMGRERVEKLKESLPRQQFRQIIQASIGSNIIARTEVPAFRKDVLAKMSGGDRTRKDKLLDKQKRGKEKMKDFAKVKLPQEVLFSLIKA